MAFLILLYWIEAHYSPWNSGHCFAISLASNKNSQLPSILRQTAKSNVKPAQWKLISKLLSTSNRTTGQNSYWWLSSSTIMLKMQAPAICTLSWIAATTPKYCIRKKLTTVPSLSQWTNYQQNQENWWLFIKKTSTMLKNFKSGLTIKTLSLKAILPTKKFGWIVSTSKSNKIESWKWSFLDRSKSYILLRSKFTN